MVLTSTAAGKPPAGCMVYLRHHLSVMLILGSPGRLGYRRTAVLSLDLVQTWTSMTPGSRGRSRNSTYLRLRGTRKAALTQSGKQEAIHKRSNRLFWNTVVTSCC